MHPKSPLFALAAFAWILCARESRADTLAVTNVGTRVVALFDGGTGFLFTPKTDILVTQVTYNDEGQTSPVIRFWSNTNFPIATYPMATSGGSGQPVSTNVSLQLLANHRYAITLEDPSLSAVLVSAYTNWLLAADLTNYTSTVITPFETFGNFRTNTLYLGANFQFQVNTGMVASPYLTIRRGNPGVILEWPAPSPGFVLVQSPALGAQNWQPVTNAVATAGGTNQVTIPDLNSVRFYRLMFP